MDVKNYLTKKADGLAEVVKAGGGYAIAEKRFSPDDGSQLEPEIRALNIKEIDAQIAQKQSEIDDLNALKTDVNSLEK